MTTPSDAQVEAARTAYLACRKAGDAPMREALTAAAQAGEESGNDRKEVMPSERLGHKPNNPPCVAPPGSAPAPLGRADETDRLRNYAGFVALWCFRESKLSDTERLSAIKYHPVTKAAHGGYLAAPAPPAQSGAGEIDNLLAMLWDWQWVAIS